VLLNLLPHARSLGDLHLWGGNFPMRGTPRGLEIGVGKRPLNSKKIVSKYSSTGPDTYDMPSAMILPVRRFVTAGQINLRTWR
jgi:hypothetical protein